MATYRKTLVDKWSGRTYQCLGNDLASKVLADYLVSCARSNAIGLYFLPIYQMAGESGLTIKQAESALKRLSKCDYATYCYSTQWVWVHRMGEVQIGAALSKNDKRRAMVLGLVKTAGKRSPELLGKWAKTYCPKWGLSFVIPKASDAPSMGYPPVTVAETVTGTVERTDFAGIVSRWNEITGQRLKPGTKETRDKIRTRLNEGHTADELLLVVEWASKASDSWAVHLREDSSGKWMRPSTVWNGKFEERLQLAQRWKAGSPKRKKWSDHPNYAACQMAWVDAGEPGTLNEFCEAHCEARSW